MKKVLMRKTAALMAMLMTVSLLIPALAFAATYWDVKGSGGTITGTVYVDSATYGALNGQDIELFVLDRVGNHVYDENGVSKKVRASYDAAKTAANSATGMTYYTFTVSSTTYSTYGSLQFAYFDPYDNAVANSGVIARNYGDGTSSGGGGGGGGGFVPGGSSNSAEISVPADGSVNAAALERALADGKATIAISGDVAKLPASALTKGGTVTIVADGASYELPISELNLEALAEELGVELKDLTITVTVAQLEGAAAQSAAAAVEAAGGEVVAGIFEFKIEAVAGGEAVELNNFSKFVKRTIELTGDADNAVGVRISGDTVAPVPTTVDGDEASIFSKSNSIYTVINVEAKSFADLAGHWSQDEVETLAGKLIVEGTGAGKFEPKRNITRAEFAAMIVRALGLQASGEATFSDVASSAWYADAVAAAAEAGIVKGDGNGTFRPADSITREEVAAMVVRALEVAGQEVELTDAQADEALASFTDAAGLSAWAKAEVAAAVEAGIVEGDGANKIAPKANANRAEAAAMVLRLLTNADFIS